MTRSIRFDRARFAPGRGIRRSTCALLLVASLLLAYCSTGGPGGGGNVGPDAGATGIGPAGGTVHSPDGALTLEIPAGALGAKVDIAVQPVANTAPGGTGSAYRLLPEGTTLAIPARLSFAITAADLAGTTLEALGVGYLSADGRWRSVNAVTREPTAVSVSTTHFSDWSRLVGWQLRPASARVSSGGTVALKVVDCEPTDDGDLLVSLLARCTPDDLLTPLVSGWAVDGIPNGNLAVGQLQAEADEAVYRAPIVVGEETHSVSVKFNPIRGQSLVLLISEVTVVGVEGFHVTGTMDLQGVNGWACSVALSDWVKDGVAFDLGKDAEGTWTASNFVNQPTTYATPVPVPPVVSVVVTEEPQVFEAYRGWVDPWGGTKVALSIVATQAHGGCTATLPDGTTFSVPPGQDGETTITVYFDPALGTQTVNLPERGWSFYFARR